MVRYVAFLRGVNVGGNTIIRKDDLKNLFETCGFDNVWTYLQSGNVIFDTRLAERESLILIESHLAEFFGKNILVILQKADVIPTILNNYEFVTFIKNSDHFCWDRELDTTVTTMAILDKKYAKQCTTRTMKMLRNLCSKLGNFNTDIESI